MTVTENLGLKKPGGSDKVLISDLNTNADKLDEIIGKLSELNTTQKSSLVAAINAALLDTSESADAAASSATAATTAKNDAVAAKTAAETAKNDAVAAKTAAETAKNDALAAKTAAETAKTDAVAAKTAAESASASATESKTAAASSAATATEKATAAANSATAAAQSASAAQAAVKPTVIPVTLAAAGWTGDAAPYRQTVTVPSGTAGSKVDVQADAEALDALTAAGVTAVYVENVSGVFSVVVLGAKPTEDIAVQLTRTEVDEYTEEV